MEPSALLLRCSFISPQCNAMQDKQPVQCKIMHNTVFYLLHCNPWTAISCARPEASRPPCPAPAVGEWESQPRSKKSATDQLFQLFQGLNTNQRHQSNFVPAIVSTPGRMYRCSVLSPIYGNNLTPSVMERMELSSSTISIFDVQGEH